MIGGRELATLGGRLRLAHEGSEKLSITTEIIEVELGVRAIIRAEVTTTKGTFTGTGTATKERDGKLSNALVELAESRAVCRACRFASFGYEVGVEEMDDAAFQANTVPDARGQVAPARMGRLARVEEPGRRQQRGGTPATAAQRRCLEALARRVHTDAGGLVARFAPGQLLDELDIGSASRVIDLAKREAGTNGDGGGRP